MALGAGLAVFAVVGQASTDDATAPTSTSLDRPAPTVLGTAVDRTTTLATSAPAAPATFALPPAPGDTPGTTRRTTPATSPPITLAPPVSITSPESPRTSTTRPHASTTTSTTMATTTTTEPATTTTESSTTTEASLD
jgi:hypothetical protein